MSAVPYASRPMSLGCLGLATASESAAKSLLRMVQPMLGNRWLIAAPSASDVVLLETPTLQTLRETGAARDDALYVVFDNATELPAGAFGHIKRPVNAARLIELLHTAQAEIERRRGLLAATTVLPDHLRAEPTDAERSIGTSLRTAIRWVLQNSTGAATIFATQERTILSAIPDKGFTTRLTAAEMADLVRRNPQVRLLSLSAHEEKALLGKQRAFASLGRLEWIYWIAGSNGELRPELAASRPYRLRAFPDFSKLPHYPGDVRMASLLKSQALTVGQLAQRAEVRFESACHFVNACFALGYLAAGAEAAARHAVV